LIFLKNLRLAVKLKIIINISIKFTKSLQGKSFRLKLTSQILHTLPHLRCTFINLKCIFNKFLLFINVVMINLYIPIKQLLLIRYWAPMFWNLSSCAVIGPACFLIQNVFLSALFINVYWLVVLQSALVRPVWYNKVSVYCLPIMFLF
jgi:hypothetical protein